MLWLLLLPLLVSKVIFVIHTGTSGFHDGSYYLDLAQNIRDGLGVLTDVSLYHQGMSYFPHPTPVYPIWPLCLGYLGRVFPLAPLAHGLPALLYLCTLLLAFSFVRSVWPVTIVSWKGWTFHAGHLMAAWLGLHFPFFMFTCQPYTEGLTYAALFLALFRAKAFFQAPNFWRGLEVGLWAGLLVLIRSQALLFAIAFLMVLPLGFFCFPKRRHILASLGFLLGLASISLLHRSYLSTFIKDPPWLMLRFDLYTATKGLSSIQLMVKNSSFWAFLKDRLYGFVVAFRWSGDYSYSNSFYFLQYSLLIASPLWLLAGLRSLLTTWRYMLQWFRHQRTQDRTNAASLLTTWRYIFRWMRKKRHLFQLFLVLLALGGFFSIHLLHKRMFAEWNFPTRHGLTCGFLFFIATVYLVKYNTWTRMVAIAFIVASLGQGFYKVDKETRREIRNRSQLPAHTKIVQWINRHTPPGKRTVFALSSPQSLAPYTPNAAYHWIYSGTTLQDLRRMFTHLGAHYLLVRVKTYHHAFFHNRKAFKRNFTRSQKSIGGYDIYIHKQQEK